MTIHYTALALACFAGLGAASMAAEYVGSDVPGSGSSVPTPTDNLQRIPPNAYEGSHAGVPYASLFRDTGAPYYNSLRDVQFNPMSQPTESLGFKGHVDLPDFRGRFPLLQRGFAPEDADLKIGPLYFKLRHISAAVLYSDNIHRSEHRESDTIGVFSIGGQIMAQLSEGFHLAVSGNLVYLPFEGKGGFDGFSLVAPYAFGLSGVPTANAQVTWEPTVFGLPLVFADEFRIGMARFSNDSYDSFDILDGGEADTVDRAGVYTVRAPTTRNFRDSGRSRDQQNDVEFTYFSNEVSLNTGGPLPGQNVFRLRASHEDIWYQEEGRGLPSGRDRVFLGAESIRDSLRFKPYASYEYLHTSDPDRGINRVRVGLKGPVTDLMDFRGDFGYFWDDNRGNSNTIWRLVLRHTPDPRTRHALAYERDVTDFLDELDERISYRITKVLGPSLDGSAYINHHRIEDLDHQVPDRTETRAGLTFNFIQSPRTSYRITGEYAKVHYDDEFGAYTNWRGRFECRHQFYDRMYARLVYQYDKRDGEVRAPTYDENLLFLSLSWIFD